MSNSSKKVIPGGVEEYILEYPKEIQNKLTIIRSAIRKVAPDAIETVSYFGIPGYCYEGYDYNGMFVWFSYKSPFVRLHVRPPVAENHTKELKGCKISTGIIGFPETSELSPALIVKLVRASLDEMKSNPNLKGK
ncbi:MAG TPA: DUF1801 domain-containing protein [Candidatus Saccharimonadales bacterium]|nr:DUF1801 domain-containing protein [Candidatus Saccharimonadales bacterium]